LLVERWIGGGALKLLIDSARHKRLSFVSTRDRTSKNTVKVTIDLQVRCDCGAMATICKSVPTGMPMLDIGLREDLPAPTLETKETYLCDQCYEALTRPVDAILEKAKLRRALVDQGILPKTALTVTEFIGGTEVASSFKDAFSGDAATFTEKLHSLCDAVAPPRTLKMLLPGIHGKALLAAKMTVIELYRAGIIKRSVLETLLDEGDE
jgi:hypothetical protein